MINKTRFPKIFFGWWTVLTGGLLNLGIVGYYSYGFSALFKPMAAELGFSRAAMSVAGSIGWFQGGVEAPLVGWLTDKFGPKWMLFAGALMGGLGLILMHFINSLWAFYLVWGGMMGIAHNLTSGVPTDKAIANWFVKRRGLAMSIRMVFLGMGGVITLPIIAWLITRVDWRITCLLGGIVILIVGIPLVLIFIRQHRPEYYGLLPDGAKAEAGVDTTQMIQKGISYAAEVREVEFTLRQAMRTIAYWVLLIAGIGFTFSFNAIQMHAIPLLTDIGIDATKAAGMIAIMVAVSLPVRIICGIIADRAKINQLVFVLGGAYLLMAAGTTVFLFNQTIAAIYVFFILFGLGMGGTVVLGSPIIARYYGRKAYGSIRGTSTMVTAVLGMSGPIFAGWVYDTTGNYMRAFIFFAIVLTLAAIIAPFARPPKPPAHISDINKIV